MSLINKSISVDCRHYRQLIEIFCHCFSDTEQSCLLAGDAEPFYLPAQMSLPSEMEVSASLQQRLQQQRRLNRIVFAHGFFASALHEIAHWCIAGSARRQQFDYGYWYEPDGRNAEQQAQFEQVEGKPQALEWLFSACVGVDFQVSVDNLGGVEVDRQAFRQTVLRQLQRYLTEALLPTRAEYFARALCAYYGLDWNNVCANLLALH
ncbi:elongation factor P hydroxylase [Idiomarina xiamenensis]|uniref:Transporting ATPase n=1 Tax=Idiomarina xiamenensis 10-D-4 TaxID=740709 RepID=K2KR09_9GAMM|nr:elongation factor P hydroxylase [Idiomarina xiamenensis]EKE84904.1 hypothetical protein A10D4_04810 [Idiomarina xiamenensis 10-D-4]